jgi:tRNA/tmRNA/rRNA uracil-C5-methylase (TrmA/RlmC/RlmD family)
VSRPRKGRPHSLPSQSAVSQPPVSPKDLPSVPAPISLQIDRVAYGGAGIGRADGMVVFVPFTVPGEAVQVKPFRLQKRFCEADLLKIETPSPLRQQPACELFERCGGCSYQHVPYPIQLEWKAAQVRELLERVGKINAPPVAQAIASPQTLGYRNRIRVHAAHQGGSLHIGFYAKRGRQIVDVQSCPIASSSVNSRLAALRNANPAPGEYTLSARPEVLFFEQTNDGAAGELARLVASLAGSGDALLVDAYCGAGFFGSLLSSSFERVTGIESHPGAVAAAQKKARPNETYLCGDVSVHLSRVLASADPKGTTVLLDPPAAGLSPQVTEILGRIRVRKLVYVSCDPATLARDLGRLVGCGYRLETVVPVDMFPQTADIEVVASLSFGG